MGGRKPNEQVVLTGRMKEVVYGYVLSDGHIDSNGTLTVEQCVEQLKFVEWMGNEVLPLRAPTSVISKVYGKKNVKDPTTGIVVKDPETGKALQESYHKSYRFFTKRILRTYRQIWYPKGTKIVPSELALCFTPLLISVWYAGDGTKIIESEGAKFEVTCFTVEDRLLLVRLFKQKHGIVAQINLNGFSKTGNQQYALVIREPESYNKLRDLLTQDPLIPTLFPYKLWKKNN